MTDCEMLELAAKAAGYDEFEGHAAQMIAGGWNPLTDAGQRYELAKKLRLRVDFEAGSVCKGWKAYILCDPANIDLAIVRAAAEIGRSMK